MQEFNLIGLFSFNRLVQLLLFNIDVSIGDDAAAMSGDFSDVFSGANLNTLRNASVTQSVHCTIYHRFGFFFFKYLGCHVFNCVVTTDLNDVPYVRGVGQRTLE